MTTRPITKGTAAGSTPAARPSLASRWRHWVFDPIDTAPMAALRIACGVLTFGWAASLLPDAQAFLGKNGLTSGAVGGTAGWWTLPVPAPRIAVVLLMVAAVALAFGWQSRKAAVLVAFGLIVLQRRDVYVLNSGDLLLRELAIMVALMPCGEVWSRDAQRRARRRVRPRPPRPRAPWGLRLLQLQVSCLYLFSVLAKLHGDSWQNGTAVGKALQLEDLQRIVLPQWLDTSVTVSALFTYGTLIVETSLVLGLWFTRTRYWVMGAGVAMHLGIEGTLLIGWFSLTVIACYLAFVPAADLRRAVGWARNRVRRPAPPPVVETVTGSPDQRTPGAHTGGRSSP